MIPTSDSRFSEPAPASPAEMRGLAAVYRHALVSAPGYDPMGPGAVPELPELGEGRS